jgi:hypothetical protein
MKTLSRRRALRRVLVLGTVLAGMLLPAAPAQAAEPSWTLTTSPGTVTRNNQKYLMTVQVHEQSGVESLTLTLRKVSDPAGVKRSVQSHTFGFSLSNKFAHTSSTLKTAKLATGTALGKYGSMTLNFAQNAALRTSCGGRIKTRTGTISGSMGFKTNVSNFGTITNRPTRGTLVYDNGKCAATNGEGGGGGVNACPSPDSMLSGSRDGGAPMTLVASKRSPSATSASVFAAWMQNLPVANGWLSHTIAATLPGANVTIPNNLSSGKVVGASGTWLSGTANYAPNGGAFTTPKTNCGTDKAYTMTLRMGTITGNFKADYWLGPDRSLGQGPLSNAMASRTVIVPR